MLYAAQHKVNWTAVDLVFRYGTANEWEKRKEKIVRTNHGG